MVDSDVVLEAEQFWTKLQTQNNIILYGAGAQGKKICKFLLEKGIIPLAVCDSNPAITGKNFCERYVIQSYQEIQQKYKDYSIIITASPSYAGEIKQFLKMKGEKKPAFHMMIPFKVDDIFLDYRAVREQKEYTEIYHLLEDSLSKQIWRENIRYKMLGDGLQLWQLIDGDSFFDKSILGNDTGNYVDVGAYTGDTLRQFLEFSGGAYEGITAIEADKGNFASLKKFIQYGAIDRVRAVCQGVWSRKEKRKYYTVAGNAEVNYCSPNLFRNVDFDIDNKVKQTELEELTAAVEEEIEVDTLDNILISERPTIMKINALAADFPILTGAADTIRRCKPAIIMEYGVRPDYLLDEILWLHELKLGYRFYIRQKKIFGDSKTVLYAV